MKYEFIGWCNEGIHDKVWGVITLQKGDLLAVVNKYMIFWGRRGNKLQTKILTDSIWGIGDKITAKKGRGYNSVDTHELSELCPEFERDLSKATIMAMLKV